MSADSKIEWTDRTWNPTVGCDKVSPGCAGCYAVKDARRLSGNPNPKIATLYAGTTTRHANGMLDWTGVVRTAEDRLLQPLSWRKPARVFVNSMSDLFHEDVPFEFIAKVWGVMSLTPQHTYQILTKRAERMRQIVGRLRYQSPGFREAAVSLAEHIRGCDYGSIEWHCSLGNQLLAWIQCLERGLEPGPMATYATWQGCGRQVRKGAKAIVLCQPMTLKRTAVDDQSGDETVHAFTRFTYRPKWFVLSQTDGLAFVPPALPEWNTDTALAALDVTEIAFDLLDGNCQGFARGRSVAVSPIAALPFKTLVHELAHVVLGHTAEHDMTDGDRTPRDIREVEAESVALLVLGSLGADGLDACRGYIQHWLRGQEIPERSAQRIFKAADTILRAGRVELVETVAEAA